MGVESLFRSNISVALEDPHVRVTLPRYKKILDKKMPSCLQIARGVPVKFTPKMKYKQLWEIHAQAEKSFEDLKKKIDSGKITFSTLEKPVQDFLDLKVEVGQRMLKKCELCEHKCRENRYEKKGFCGIGIDSHIFGAHMHWGEEACISPSATLFHAGCNLRCVHCQNAPDSTDPSADGRWSPVQVAQWMETLGPECRNVNFVGGDPTPHLPNILTALKLYEGNLPIVWNSNAYCSEQTMHLLHGVVDVFLFDFKYFNGECARRLSKIKQYPETAARNHLWAAEQSELLIRILVLPNHVECDAKSILRWIAQNLKERALVNVLGQYHPCWRASNYPDIAQPLDWNVYRDMLAYARSLGLHLTP